MTRVLVGSFGRMTTEKEMGQASSDACPIDVETVYGFGSLPCTPST